MRLEQKAQQPEPLQGDYHFPWGRISFVLIVLLSIAVCTIVWIYLGTDAGILVTILFTAFTAAFAFLQLTPSLFSKETESTSPPIIIHAQNIQPPPLSSLLAYNQSVLDRSTYFEKTQQAEIEQSQILEALPLVWNVPYQRNQFFTGRETNLKDLHDEFKTNHNAALTKPQAISGLGGIGKTQIAVEYAYRYHDEYKVVLWARAGSYESLATDYVVFADLLNLPEKEVKDQIIAILAVKHWLETHNKWLLILDNADDLTNASNFLPLGNTGHILLTTREKATGGIARQIEIEKMEPEEGALFLLRRINNIAPNASFDNFSAADRIKAEEISKVMDGLPLALDQAGAYIEETDCGLSSYLNRYHTQQAKLLQRRGRLASDHPESIFTTLKISFEKVKRQSRTAANLLRLCAFLNPDAIPEEIIIKGALFIDWTLYDTDIQFKLDLAIEELLKFSLVHRNPVTKTLTIHRLVQAILKDEMNKREQRKWAKRSVRALHAAFPHNYSVTWQNYQQFLSHVQACTPLINQWSMKFHAAPCLLNTTGDYLYNYSKYLEAELLYKQALAIFKKNVMPRKYNYITMSFFRLAELYRAQSKFEQAESFYQQAQFFQRKIWGPKDYHKVIILRNLAKLYQAQAKFIQAESFYQQALSIFEKSKKSNKLAKLQIECYRELALLYIAQDKYDQAKPLLRAALDNAEQGKESENPSSSVASSLNGLALLYQTQGEFTQAESLYQQALAIQEKTLGLEDHLVADTLRNLAHHYAYHRDLYIKAEPLYKRALSIREQWLGSEHPDVADILDELAGLYQFQGNFDQAASLYQQALAIKEKILGSEHSDVAYHLYRLATLYHQQTDYIQAESLYQRALTIREQTLGQEHLKVAIILASLAKLYKDQIKYTQAESLYQRILMIRERILGPEHLDVATTLANFADLLRKMQRDAEATEIEMHAKGIQGKHSQDRLTYRTCAKRYEYE